MTRQCARLTRTACVALLLASAARFPTSAEGLDARLVEAEAMRVETVQAITPATIAIFDGKGEGGGSGVIVSADGLAVTNFHVVAPCGPFMSCGLPDGRLVGAVLVGLDPVGDVALIQLVERPGEEASAASRPAAAWPVANWGDSDQVRVGDEAFVAGNPFLLAHDFQPTITFGIISGTHRYQYPSGTLLEYADCLQTDAAINPGNSGGPLYDARGRLIGINGRGSFEKRGRVNVGVGYAISSNQVQRFLSHLKSGRILDHASLGATVRTVAGNRVVIDQIRMDTDAYRRGLRYGDEIVRIAGRRVASANALQNAIATYPPGVRVPIEFRQGEASLTAMVRLSPRHGAAQLEALVGEQFRPKPAEDGPTPQPPPELRRLYEARPGFANFHFNRAARDAVLRECPQRGAAPGKEEVWRISAGDVGGGGVTLEFDSERASFESDRGRFWVQVDAPLHDQLAPPGSGGLLAALELWRRVLSPKPPRALEYVGQAPWGPSARPSDVLSINQNGAVAEFWFDAITHDLVAVEFMPSSRVDSCLVEFSGFHLGGGKALPERLQIRHGDAPWMELAVTKYSQAEVPRKEGPR